MIQIEEKHRKLITEIMQKYQFDFFVFGSRAKGLARPLSDLDLCIKSQVSKSTIRRLQDEFEESDLPYKVDLILWGEISNAFKKNIESDLILFDK